MVDGVRRAAAALMLSLSLGCELRAASCETG